MFCTNPKAQQGERTLLIDANIINSSEEMLLHMNQYSVHYEIINSTLLCLFILWEKAANMMYMPSCASHGLLPFTLAKCVVGMRINEHKSGMTNGNNSGRAFGTKLESSHTK